MTLTEVSFYSRKIGPFALLFFLMLMIFYYLIKILLLTLLPTQQGLISLEPIFGKIKKPVITNAKPSTNLKFSIDTIEGRPTTATEAARIFFLPPPTARFGYREKIYLMAKTLGFDTEVIKHKLEGKEASFSDDRQSLKIDITNLNFIYEYNFEDEPEIFQNTVIPQSKESEDKAVEFLQSVGRYPEELTQGKLNTVFISYDSDAKQMKLLPSGVSANLVEVDFYRPDQDQYPIVSPKYFNSQNYVMMVPYQNDFKIIKAQMKFFEKSESQVGAYPLKTGDKAWEDLKAGKGFVVQNESTEQNIVIKKMFLGYYDPDAYQGYLQPVYVFLGSYNFVAYVPAVSPDYSTE